MSGKPNWFIGLRVEAELAEPAGAPAAVRVFDRDDWHLTVVFLGGCGEEVALEAFAALAPMPFPGFQAELAEVVPMGNPQRYSALSALLGAGREPVERWMQAAREVVELTLHASAHPSAAAVRIDRRPVKAHLTLARPQRRASDAERATALAWGQALPTQGVPVRLPSLALYTWSEDRARRLFRIAQQRDAEV